MWESPRTLRTLGSKEGEFIRAGRSVLLRYIYKV